VDPSELGNAVLRLGLATLLGGVIGWQREAHDRPAGFRTHILVCVGSCLVMIVSLGVASPLVSGTQRADPGRIAAQVVSGIGFLGAGTILRQGSVVRGLTTAASLWTVAAIGLAAGVGGAFAALAGIATVLVLATLTVLRSLEAMLVARGRFHELQAEADRQAVGSLLAGLAARGISILSIETSPLDQGALQRLRLTLRVPPDAPIGEMAREFAEMPGIRAMDWD